MPRTFSSITSLTTACLAAAFFAPPALAQGVLKPLEALIVNPANRPVPVTVIAPPATAAPPTAMCRFDIVTGIASDAIARNVVFHDISLLDCADGVTRLDVDRVVFVSGLGSTSNLNQVRYTVSLGLGRLVGTSFTLDAPIATVSDGTPDLSLRRAVRIDKSAAGVTMVRSIQCSSGLAGVQVACGGTVFLIGTRVN